MISVSITADSANAEAFLVRVTGALQNPRAFNAELAARLESELKDHFLARNAEPNKMGAPKTNFWENVRDKTLVSEITDTGATVSIGADSHFRIHLLGGTIKPTGGRKWLTIPILKEAHGLNVAGYEAASGNKLFRPGGARVLMERSDKGTQSTLTLSRGSIRTRAGDFKQINLKARSLLRAVFALATEATIKKDPRALPPQNEILAALTETADAYLAGLATKGAAS